MLELQGKPSARRALTGALGVCLSSQPPNATAGPTEATGAQSSPWPPLPKLVAVAWCTAGSGERKNNRFSLPTCQSRPVSPTACVQLQVSWQDSGEGSLQGTAPCKTELSLEGKEGNWEQAGKWPAHFSPAYSGEMCSPWAWLEQCNATHPFSSFTNE